MQTFPEKIAETGSAGHPFVTFDMALWMHLPLVNSQFCFSLFSYFLFVFSELALLNLSGAVFECIDKSPCTSYVI